MAVRVMVGSLLASVVMFMWGFVFWGISGLAVSTGMLSPMPGEAAHTLALRTREFMQQAPSGVYAYPFQPSPGADEAALQTFQGRYAAGPVYQIFYQADGAPPMATVMVLGWLHMFVWCLVCALVLVRLLPTLGRFRCRMGIMVGIALLASGSTNLGEAIWFPHPWTFRLGKMGYEFVGILLAGIVLSAVIKRTATAGSPPPVEA